MSSRRKAKRELTTLREWVRDAGGLRYRGDLEAFTREGMGEYLNAPHRRNGRALSIRLPSRPKPIVHPPGVARGMSLDTATESAFELGFFPLHPTPNEFIAALDRDARHPSAPIEQPTDVELERTRHDDVARWDALEWLRRRKWAGSVRDIRRASSPPARRLSAW